ncbi:hypothetical protein [Sulfuriferula plumbiphila]|nr:hypothetical protein [Sulfuriferula plumbiphila]
MKKNTKNAAAYLPFAHHDPAQDPERLKPFNVFSRPHSMSAAPLPGTAGLPRVGVKPNPQGAIVIDIWRIVQTWSGMTGLE